MCFTILKQKCSKAKVIMVPKSLEVLYLSTVVFKVSLGSYTLMSVRLPLFQKCLKLDKRWQRRTKNLLGEMEIFCILILVVVPGVHTSVKTH